MPYAGFFLLITLFFLGPGAEAKSVSGDCADCGVKKQRGEAFGAKGIEAVLDELTGVPAKLPAPQKFAAYGGHKQEPMKPGYPWNNIGRLFLTTGTIDFCTATRISACHIISAGHCVRDKTGGYESGIAFVPPFEKSVHLVDRVLAGKGEFEKDRFLDWAVMRLEDSEAGNTGGWLGIKERQGSQLTGKSFLLSGYNQDLSPRAKEAYVDAKAEVIRTNKGIFSGNQNHIFLRANTGPGGSGAPLFEFDEAGKAWLVGLSVAGAVGPDGKPAFFDADETEALGEGVATNAFLDKIQKFMAENPCKP